MHPKLLETYNEEVLRLREHVGEFGGRYPKIARRLGVHGEDIGDPFIERLIQSFGFVAARMRLQLDAAFPRLTRRLLEVVYPNYVRPTPSMGVVRFYPCREKGDLVDGYPIARGTAYDTRLPNGERTPCTFRTTQALRLYPLEIIGARLTGIPPDIPDLARYVPGHRRVRGALRLRIRTTGAQKIAELKNLDRLPVYLGGEEQIASRLFELLHAASIASVVGEPGGFNSDARPYAPVTSNAVAHEGLGVDQGMLPLASKMFHGHNLLHEYFVCASRFYFFTLTGLRPGLAKVSGDEVEIVVLLDQPTEHLADQVDARQFALFCSPVINLYPQTIDKIALKKASTEFHLVAKQLAPLDYEVHSVDALEGQVSKRSAKHQFRPLDVSLRDDEGNHGRYFVVRREQRLHTDSIRRYGTRTPYSGTETFISLVDEQDEPYHQGMRYLSVDAWLTNRDLPSLVPYDGVNDFPETAGPIDSIGFVRPPTAPRAPYADGETAWQLLRQLSFNYLALEDLDYRASGEGLRDMVRTFLSVDDVVQRQRIDSLVDLKTRPVIRKLPGNGAIVFGQGIECKLTIDENGFAGQSPYLFGLILDHYLARHVSMHAFTQTELHSGQRGRVMRWPVRMGARGVA